MSSYASKEIGFGDWGNTDFTIDCVVFANVLVAQFLTVCRRRLNCSKMSRPTL